MRTAEGVRRRLEAAGLVVREREPGVLRGYHCTPSPGGTLTLETLHALFVVRGEQVTYAEFVDPGEVRPVIYWAHGTGWNDRAYLDNLYQLIKESTFQ